MTQVYISSFTLHCPGERFHCAAALPTPLYIPFYIPNIAGSPCLWSAEGNFIAHLNNGTSGGHGISPREFQCRNRIVVGSSCFNRSSSDRPPRPSAHVRPNFGTSSRYFQPVSLSEIGLIHAARGYDKWRTCL
jgi:hypothetical protein